MAIGLLGTAGVSSAILNLRILYNYLNDKDNDLEKSEKEQLKNDLRGIEDEIKGLININDEVNKKTPTIKKNYLDYFSLQLIEIF